MNTIPLNTYAEHEQTFRVLPLGDFTPYNYYKPHRHDYFEIFFFEKGSGRHFIDFVEYPIQDCSVHIVFPQQVHLVKRSEDAMARIVLCSPNLIQLLHKQFMPLLLYFYGKPCIPADRHLFFELYELVRKMEELQADSGFWSKQIGNHYFSIILSHFVRLLPGQSVHATHKSELEIFTAFTRLVDEYFPDKSSVSFYAEKLSVSTKVLNAAVQKISNTSSIQMIQDRTMIEAKRLLLYTHDSIKEIAYRLNFKDSSYFTRFFLRNEKMTPKDFRKFWEEKYHS